MNDRLCNNVIENEVLKVLRENKYVSLSGLERRLGLSENQHLVKLIKERDTETNLNHLDSILGVLVELSIGVSYTPDFKLEESICSIEDINITTNSIFKKFGESIVDDIRSMVFVLKEPTNLDSFFYTLTAESKGDGFFTSDQYDDYCKKYVMEKVIDEHRDKSNPISEIQIYKHNTKTYVYKDSKLVDKSEIDSFYEYVEIFITNSDGISYEDLFNHLKERLSYSHFLYDSFGKKNKSVLNNILESDDFIIINGKYHFKNENNLSSNRESIISLLKNTEKSLSIEEILDELNYSVDDIFISGLLETLVNSPASSLESIELAKFPKDEGSVVKYFHQDNFLHILNSKDALVFYTKEFVEKYLISRNSPQQISDIFNSIKIELFDLLGIVKSSTDKTFYLIIEYIFEQNFPDHTQIENLGIITFNDKQYYFIAEDINNILDGSNFKPQKTISEDDVVNPEFLDIKNEIKCLYRKYTNRLDKIMLSERDLIYFSKEDIETYMLLVQKISNKNINIERW